MPQAAKKICPAPGCHKTIHAKDKDCGGHPDRAHQGRANPNRHIYDSKQWRMIARQHKRENLLCVICLKEGIVTPVYCTDHIISINAGGSPFDWDNLQSLCKSHHEAKSSKEGRK